MQFRTLTAEEEIEFRRWARENYVVDSKTNDLYHPCVQDECRKMNEENKAKN